MTNAASHLFWSLVLTPWAFSATTSTKDSTKDTTMHTETTQDQTTQDQTTPATELAENLATETATATAQVDNTDLPSQVAETAPAETADMLASSPEGATFSTALTQHADTVFAWEASSAPTTLVLDAPTFNAALALTQADPSTSAFAAEPESTADVSNADETIDILYPTGWGASGLSVGIDVAAPGTQSFTTVFSEAAHNEKLSQMLAPQSAVLLAAGWRWQPVLLAEDFDVAPQGTLSFATASDVLSLLSSADSAALTAIENPVATRGGEHLTFDPGYNVIIPYPPKSQEADYSAGAADSGSVARAPQLWEVEVQALLERAATARNTATQVAQDKGKTTAEMQEELQLYKEVDADRTTELAALRDALSLANSDRDQLAAQVNAVSENLAHANKLLAYEQETVLTLREELATAESAVSAANVEAATWKSQCAAITHDMETLKAGQDIGVKALDAAVQEVTDLQSELAMLQAQGLSADQERTKLQATIEELRGEALATAFTGQELETARSQLLLLKSSLEQTTTALEVAQRDLAGAQLDYQSAVKREQEATNLANATVQNQMTLQTELDKKTHEWDAMFTAQQEALHRAGEEMASKSVRLQELENALKLAGEWKDKDAEIIAMQASALTALRQELLQSVAALENLAQV